MNTRPMGCAATIRVIYRGFEPHRLPRTGQLGPGYSSTFDPSAIGTPASQGGSDTDAGWLEIDELCLK